MHQIILFTIQPVRLSVCAHRVSAIAEEPISLRMRTPCCGARAPTTQSRRCAGRNELFPEHAAAPLRKAAGVSATCHPGASLATRQHPQHTDLFVNLYLIGEVHKYRCFCCMLLSYLVAFLGRALRPYFCISSVIVWFLSLPTWLVVVVSDIDPIFKDGHA